MLNVLFINGWGGAITSTSLAGLRNRTVAEFGREIYAPPPVNHTETGLILRYIEKWKNAQILVGLSCGCSTINLIATHAAKGERIPFAMYFSPSMWCRVGHVRQLVERAAEVHSTPADPFNFGSRRLIVPVAGNTKTTFDPPIRSGRPHGFTPDSPEAQRVLFGVIRGSLD